MLLFFIVSWILLTHAFTRLFGKIRTQETKNDDADIISSSPDTKNDDVDIISSLPDSVICHIVSKLTLTEAVKMSVLSKDWKHKYTTTYNVYIVDWQPFKHWKTEQMFFNFVDKMLEVKHDLKSFRLVSCGDYNYTDDRVRKWISAALGRRIESFEFRHFGQSSCVVPISLFNNSTTLRTLNLMCFLKVPRDINFSRLTDMYLDGVKFLSDSNQLVFTFPALKTFAAIACQWQNVKLVEIYSPALRTFKSESSDWVDRDHVIKIYGARLETFISRGQALHEDIRLVESTVQKAALQILDSAPDSFVKYGLRARKQMEGFVNLAKLKLCSLLCEAIALSIQELRIPKFDSLLRLEMVIVRNAELLLELLHSAPSLKFLILDTERTKEFEMEEVDCVPYCVTNNLKKVLFINGSYNHLFHLANFFMKNQVELEEN